MKSSCRGRATLATVAILTLALAASLAAQSAGRTNLAAQIQRSSRDSDLVSPITGVPVPREAVRLAQDAITNPTAQVRTRFLQSLVPSGARQTVLEHLLTSLPPLANDPTTASLVQARAAFNQFVNVASPGFLVDPPAEFLALHALLLHVSSGV